MIGMLGKIITEMEVVKFKDGEAFAVLWENPGPTMKFKIDHPSIESENLEVQVIGLVVKKREKKEKTKLSKKIKTVL